MPKPGYTEDFISGTAVRATPEELHAVQVFSRILVEDYGYPKTLIRTRPQWHVRARPSDTKKEYPVDIAVFADTEHSEENTRIIVECKKPNRQEGLVQLKDYLRFSKAQVGVWFNGKERLYLQKTEHDGQIDFATLPNIPRRDQRVEDIGKFLRRDLRPALNLQATFRAIRNYLAANAVGVTLDETLAQQMINLILCKIYDERFTEPDRIVTFRAGVGEDDNAVKQRILKTFETVKGQYKDVLETSDAITLDATSLAYVVGELQPYSLQDSTRDAVGAAFETFIGPALKGGQGQFFTPRNVVKMVVDMIDPKGSERIIDPACGSGGFLVEALRHIWKDVERRGNALHWKDSEIEAEKQKAAMNNLRGVDKDSSLSKVAKAYMAILGDGRGGVFCENSLANFKKWKSKTRNAVAPESFDVVITNPPFGKKLAIKAVDTLKQYDLGHRWKHDPKTDTYEKGSLYDKQPPQILFIERCLELLKPGGRLGIVLPETLFGMPKYRYVVNYLQRHTKLRAIVTMPEDLFQPYTHAKCCVIIAEKRTIPSDETYHIFMAEAKWCGHDSRGNRTVRRDSDGNEQVLDDIPQIADLYREGPKL